MASVEPELPLDEDTNDDGATVHDRGIGELIAESTHVVVGKIVEAKEVKKATRGGTTVQRDVVIAIEGFLAGEPTSGHAP